MKRKSLLISLVLIIFVIVCTIYIPNAKLKCFNDSEQDDEMNISKKIDKIKYEMITGVIKEINEEEGKRSLLIEDEEGSEYIFRINEHTIVLTFEKLKEGQKVDIIFNGILTKSIPPQGNAIIVDGLKL